MNEWIGENEETVRYEWGNPDLIDKIGKATVYIITKGAIVLKLET